MKHLLATTALLVSIALAVAFIAYRLSDDREVSAVLERRDALEWLRTDFHLDAAQFAAIKQLHESYSVVCEEHCRLIQVATRERNALRTASPLDSAALTNADQRVHELRLVCETAIAAHVREVATHMSREDGGRYLALVLPKIADFDHRAAPDLGVSRHDH